MEHFSSFSVSHENSRSLSIRAVAIASNSRIRVDEDFARSLRIFEEFAAATEKHQGRGVEDSSSLLREVDSPSFASLRGALFLVAIEKLNERGAAQTTANEKDPRPWVCHLIDFINTMKMDEVLLSMKEITNSIPSFDLFVRKILLSPHPPPLISKAPVMALASSAMAIEVARTCSLVLQCAIAMIADHLRFPLPPILDCLVERFPQQANAISVLKGVSWVLEESKLQDQISKWTSEDRSLDEEISVWGALLLKIGTMTEATDDLERTCRESMRENHASSPAVAKMFLSKWAVPKEVAINQVTAWTSTRESRDWTIQWKGRSLTEILRSVICDLESFWRKTVSGSYEKTMKSSIEAGGLPTPVPEISASETPHESLPMSLETWNAINDAFHTIKQFPSLASPESNARALAHVSLLLLSVAIQCIASDDVSTYRDAVAKVMKKKKPGSLLTPIGRGGRSVMIEFNELLSSRGGSYSQCHVPILKCMSQTKLPLWSETFENLLTPLNQGGRRPKTAKGTRDYGGQRMAIRAEILKLIQESFRLHGAVQIDTSVLELKETLVGKYGEDSKLIYDLKDQGGEQLSLRYDLTVPFARFIATHGIEKIRRYQIGKVYRRDEPQLSKGRYREFYQCDIDIAGAYDSMTADAEILSVLIGTLRKLGNVLGDFEVKVNHRKALDGMMQIAGVPPSKFKAVCSSIDKLDKESWDKVRKELCDVKGLSDSSVEKLREFVVLRGQPFDLLEKLEANSELTSVTPWKEALKELRTLFEFLEASQSLDAVTFDLSLARGLDYYTGPIFEAALVGANVGSIAGGGRYDELLGMFSGKNTPAVGVSIGVERVFRVVERRLGFDEESLNEGVVGLSSSGGVCEIRGAETDVLVCSIGKSFMTERMRIASELRDVGISTQFAMVEGLNIRKQLNIANDERIDFAIVFGEEEISRGVVQVRDVPQGEDTKETREEVARADLVSHMLKLKSGGGSSKLRALILNPPAAVEGKAEIV